MATTATAFIDQVNFELRNRRKLQYSDQELFQYLNYGYETLHNMLVRFEVDLARVNGEFSTVIGQANSEYLLSDIGLDDLLSVDDIRLHGGENMRLLGLPEFDSTLASFERGEIQAQEPTSYFLGPDSISLFDPADAVYTAKVRYYPHFSPLVASFDSNGAFTTGLPMPNMPYRNIFNNVISGMIKVLSKNRNADGSQVDPALMAIAQEQVLRILDTRQPADTVTDYSYANRYWGG